ncbi:hypothetical protein AMTRI_Chr12g238130 [Amborella trichopoda]
MQILQRDREPTIYHLRERKRAPSTERDYYLGHQAFFRILHQRERNLLTERESHEHGHGHGRRVKHQPVPNEPFSPNKFVASKSSRNKSLLFLSSRKEDQTTPNPSFSLFSVNSIVDAACLAGNPSLPPTPPMAQARTDFPATFPTKPNFPLTIPAKIQRALTTSGLHRLMEFFLSIERSTPRGRRCIKLTASI